MWPGWCHLTVLRSMPKSQNAWKADLKTILFVEPGDISAHAYPKHNRSRAVERLAKHPYPRFFQGHDPLKSKVKSNLEQEFNSKKRRPPKGPGQPRSLLAGDSFYQAPLAKLKSDTYLGASRRDDLARCNLATFLSALHSKSKDH